MRTLLTTLTLLAAAPAAASTVTIHPDHDNTLCQFGDSSNALGDIFVGRTGQADADSRRRGVFHFDVAGSVPAGATITSVKLRLYMNTAADATSHTLSLFPASASWGEGTSLFNGGRCAAKTTNDASWTYRFYNATSWTSAGGDHGASASQTCSVGTTFQYYEWTSNSAMIGDVQGWLNSPSSNNGWELIGDESTSATARRFTSREGASTELPELVITYTAGGLRATSAAPAVALPGGLRYLATRDLDGDGELDILARDDHRDRLVGIHQGVIWEIQPERDDGDPLAR